MRADLLVERLRQTLFGQAFENRRVKYEGHDGAIGKNNEWKEQVKFLREHVFFSVQFLSLLQDEAPILLSEACGTAFDACDSGARLC